MDGYRTFPCPACAQIVDTLMSACKSCGAAIDPAAAAAAADVHERVQKACGAASSARITATGLPVLFVVSFLPFLGGMATAGTIVLLVLVPIELLRWHLRYRHLESPDPDLLQARGNLRVALFVWVVMLVVASTWYGIHFAALLRSPRAY